MTTESHICVLDHPYPGGVMGCACGRFWMYAPWSLRKFAFVSEDLRRRLEDYQRGVRWDHYESIAAAVSNAERRLREKRAADNAKARRDWERLQRAKQAKWQRCVREIMLPAPCTYCGVPATGLDHIMPTSRGGSHKIRNLAPACGACNSEKFNRTPDEWKAWRLRLGRPWPPVRTEAAA